MEQLYQNIEAALSERKEPDVNIEARLEELQKKLLKLSNSKADYTEIADEIDRLREQKQNTLVENAECDGLGQRIDEMIGFLNEQDSEIEGYDEALVRKMIERVTVYDDKFEVEFKAGVKLDIDRTQTMGIGENLRDFIFYK